jgi:hypothetical protein
MKVLDRLAPCVRSAGVRNKAQSQLQTRRSHAGTGRLGRKCWRNGWCMAGSLAVSTGILYKTTDMNASRPGAATATAPRCPGSASVGHAGSGDQVVSVSRSFVFPQHLANERRFRSRSCQSWLAASVHEHVSVSGGVNGSRHLDDDEFGVVQHRELQLALVGDRRTASRL